MYGLALNRVQRPTPAASGGLIQVAACIIRDAQGRVLMARRRPDQKSPGFWEIPGGKIEPGESPEAAAQRELLEETGIQAVGLRPVASYQHRFPMGGIYLNLFEARAWTGTPVGREGQALEWVCPKSPQVGPVLASNFKALRLLSLPNVVLWTRPPAANIAAWTAECGARARAVSAGAVLFCCQNLPAPQQVALASRLRKELARQGLGLWMAAAPDTALRARAEVSTLERGNPAPHSSGMICAAFNPKDPARCSTDMVLMTQGWADTQPAVDISAPVYILHPLSDADSMFGVCIRDG